MLPGKGTNDAKCWKAAAAEAASAWEVKAGPPGIGCAASSAHLALEGWDSAPHSVSVHPSVLGSMAGPVGTLHILIDLDLGVSLCKIAVVETHLSECFLRP